jgi:sulfur carrier protein
MTELITVNGVEETLGDRSIAELLAARGIAAEARGIAVARNGAVVLRRLWPTTRLAAGDAIEIIKAVSGG